ncbi:hypothetical protein GMST_32900 [Geomonas silvestris]|uniref:AAA+ ATPase domain-containing protein n=1 Tax=Geomonas silvestris TaxID=2740184 RepID=A0A6V8MLP6_9BACT|nr:AAA family ATPase [Geomonas silvestris]GFO60965.1 hypothetical protein GMST_32900 [Geomonas silvestris]
MTSSTQASAGGKIIDFNLWGVDENSNAPTSSTGPGDLSGAARAACLELGIIYQATPADGNFHALDVEGKATRNGAGRIRLYPDAEGGQIWNHVTGETRQFWAESDHTLTPVEQEARRQKAKEEREKAEALLAAKRSEAAKLALDVLKASQPADGNAYLVRKQIEPTDYLREISLEGLVNLIGYHPQSKGEPFAGERVLIVPVTNGESVTTIEIIDREGRKAGLKDGLKKGCFWSDRSLPGGDGEGLTFIIGEGVATVRTCSMATGHFGIAALSSTNLKTVAASFRGQYPKAQLIVAADKGNGEQSAIEAAQLAGGVLVAPNFPEPKGAKETDFNDLAQRPGGMEAVRLQLVEAAAKEAKPAAPVPPFDLSRLKTAADIRSGDYQVEYVCEGLVPEGATILWYGVGGSGKTTLAHQLGHAISDGMPFMGLQTKRRPVVFLDPENPMGVLKQGLSRIKGGEGVFYWTTADEPPQLDGPEWEQLKSLVITLQNPVLIIDTLQAATSGLDITSNKDYSPVMARLKQLREMGSTIVLLHHTPKNDATTYVGASVIYNQVDHVLAMYAVRGPGEDREALKDDEAAHVYRFGSKGKTRYGHHAIYVTFDQKTCLFKEATSPESEGLNVILAAMIDLYETTTVDIKALLAALKDSGCLLDTSEHHVRKLLKKGEDVYWVTSKGLYNKTLYTPLKNSLNGTASENRVQVANIAEFDSFTDPSAQTVKLHEQGPEQCGATLDHAQKLQGTATVPFWGAKPGSAESV